MILTIPSIEDKVERIMCCGEVKYTKRYTYLMLPFRIGRYNENTLDVWLLNVQLDLVQTILQDQASIRTQVVQVEV